ncbi:MAG: AAA family ATPase [Candidatus Paceibacterota bacterium]
MPVLDKVSSLISELNQAMAERGHIIEAMLAALISSTHILLLGPPGTAKSYAARCLCNAIDGAGYFEWLLTKFSTPEEVFGPVSLKGLKQDEYRRVTSGKLPEAHIVFLDEALDLDTPIPTPTGWTTIRDIKVGDTLLSASGKPTIVTGVTKVFENKKCYKFVFENGESLVCDAGHRWLCRKSRSNHKTAHKVRTAEEMYNEHVTGKRWQIPLPKPVELQENMLPADPYTLGCWLGNGNSWNMEIYVRKEIAAHTAHEIQKTTPNARITGAHKKSSKLEVISLAGTGFRTHIGDLGLLKNRSTYLGSGKYIPLAYKRGSIHQRMRLIQGLMDTEGHIMECGTCTFSNTNEHIIDGFVEILRTLGAKCSKRPTKDNRIGKKGAHKQCWKVNFRADPDMPMFLCRSHKNIPKLVQRKHLRITSITEVAPRSTKCVSVDSEDNLFLAGRAMAVTHNCFKSNSALLNSLLSAINERIFFNNGQPVKIPLLSCIGASNELPQGEELGALYDRFLTRFWVDYIQDDNLFLDLVNPTGTVGKKEISTKLTMEDINELRSMMEKVQVPAGVLQSIRSICMELRMKHGIQVSDRRWKSIVNTLRAYALIRGHQEVTDDEIEVLSNMLWDKPDQRRTIETVLSAYTNPLNLKASQFMDAAKEAYGVWQKSAKKDTDAMQANGILKDISKAIDAEVSGREAAKTKKLVDTKTKIDSWRKEIVASIAL